VNAAAGVEATARALTPGAHLPALIRSPTRVSCFLFAVAWWAPHRVHYDVEWAHHEGYGDVMVPGLLLNEYVVTALTSWTGDPSTLRRLTVRNTAAAFAGETLTIDAAVVDVAASEGSVTLTLDFTMVKDGGVQVAGGRGVVEVDAAGDDRGHREAPVLG
jgi:hydroxyacyl-ACP dehydratase HTD2-like protein with hotdog domain